SSAYEHGIGIGEELVKLAPARDTYRTDLARSLNNLGMVQIRLGQFVDAEATLRRSRDLYESLLPRYSQDPAIQSSLGGVYNNLAVTLEGADRLEDAAAAFRAAVDHQRVACDLAPDLPRCRELLIKHYEGQGRVLSKLGRAEEARQATVAMERITSLSNSTRRQP